MKLLQLMFNSSVLDSIFPIIYQKKKKKKRKNERGTSVKHEKSKSNRPSSSSTAITQIKKENNTSIQNGSERKTNISFVGESWDRRNDGARGWSIIGRLVGLTKVITGVSPRPIKGGSHGTKVIRLYRGRRKTAGGSAGISTSLGAEDGGKPSSEKSPSPRVHGPFPTASFIRHAGSSIQPECPG